MRFGSFVARTTSSNKKLIQGAPEPDGFHREVDERRSIVICRPKTWLPQSGSIFTFKCPDEILREGDSFAPQMELSYYHIDDEALTMDKYYDTMRRNFEDGVGRHGGPYRSEMVTVGGSRGIPSLKLVARSYFRVVTQKSRLTGKVDRQVLRANKDEFAAHVRRRVEDIVGETQQPVRDTQPDATKAWDRLRHSRNLTTAISEQAEHELESGRLEYRDLREFVVKKINDDARLDGEQLDATTDDPADGASLLLSAGDANGSVEQEEILPVAEVIVCCFHETLKRVYFFEFADNSSDYATSSATFNAILATARFLR